MDRIFFVILGFLIIFPTGNFLSFYKKLTISLSLSLVAFTDIGSIQNSFSKSLIDQIIFYSSFLVYGFFIAIPFLMINQFFELLVESTELIRGVNLSSVLSPISEQHEMPLVTLVSTLLVGFIFFDNSLLIPNLEFLFDFQIQAQNINYNKLFIALTKTFSLNPSLYFFVFITMLSGDLALQIYQKVFPNVSVQDFAFVFRSINLVVIVSYMAPSIPNICAQLINSTNILLR